MRFLRTVLAKKKHMGKPANNEPILIKNAIPIFFKVNPKNIY